MNDQEGATKYFHDDLMKLICTYSWPGNIRQLKFEIKVAYYQSGKNNIINICDLSDELCLYSKNSNNKTVVVASNDKILTLYYLLVEKRECFWELVHKPYRKGDLNRSEVQYLIKLGLKEVNDLNGFLKLFKLQKDDYRKFYHFIHRTIFNGNIP